jgi:hypothetical protein
MRRVRLSAPDVRKEDPMSEPVTVDVTAEDIAQGTPRCAGMCPIALAMKRALGREDIEVRHTRASIGDEVVVLPPEAWEFILSFDHDRPVPPFRFRLETGGGS